jgi:hypothetical protein
MRVEGGAEIVGRETFREFRGERRLSKQSFPEESEA